MKNEKKDTLQILSVKLSEKLIEELKAVVNWRKKNNFTLSTIQEQVEIALRQHLLKHKPK